MSGELITSGNLVQTPIGTLLVELFRAHETGRIVIQRDGGEDSILVSGGFPINVTLATGSANLGQILFERGWIDERAFAEAMEEVAETGIRLGQVLMLHGELSQDRLKEALEIQCRRNLLQIFAYRHGRFAAYREAIEEEPESSFMLDPFKLVYDGMRGHYDEARVERELGLKNEAMVRCIAPEERVLAVLDRNDVELVQEWVSLTEDAAVRAEILLDTGPRGPFHNGVLLLFLKQVGHIRLRHESGSYPTGELPPEVSLSGHDPIAAPAEQSHEELRRAAPVAARTLPREASAAAAEAAASGITVAGSPATLLRHWRSADLYTVLGVPRSAVGFELKTAFARRRAMIADLPTSTDEERRAREACDVFVHAAAMILANSKSREAYDKLVERARDPAHATQDALVRAGDVALLTQRYSEAAGLYRLAGDFSGDPGVNALASFAKWMGDPNRRADDTEPEIAREIAARSPSNPRALAAAGLFALENGDTDSAQELLGRAVERDASLHLATRTLERVRR